MAEPQQGVENPVMEERSYILTGLQEGTESVKWIKQEIDAELRQQQIKAHTKSVHVGFTSAEVLLHTFTDEPLLGLVTISGDNLKHLRELGIKGRGMKLHSLPVDAFGTTEVKLNDLYAIPSCQNDWITLCRDLGLKIALDNQNIWLVGDLLQINIARKNLKHWNSMSCEFEFMSSKPEKKKDMYPIFLKPIPSDKHTMEEISLEFPLEYLFLVFYLDKTPSGGSLYIKLSEQCSQARVFVQLEKSYVFQRKGSSANYVSQLNKTVDELQKTYRAVCLTEPRQSDYRKILEDALERSKPVLSIKCPKHFWSCYMYPTDRADEAEQFMETFLKHTTPKSLKGWWSDLPKDVQTTRAPCPKQEVPLSSREREESEMIGESNEKKKIPSSTIGTRGGEKPEIPPKKRNFPVELPLQVLQYLYGNLNDVIQSIEAVPGVQLAFDQNTLQIMNTTVEDAKIVEQKMKEMLHSANLKVIDVKELLTHDSNKTGTILIKYSANAVSARGPKEFLEVFQKTLKDTTRSKGKTEKRKPVDREEQRTETCEQQPGREKSLRNGNMIGVMSQRSTESPPSTPTEEKKLPVSGSGYDKEKSGEEVVKRRKPRGLKQDDKTGSKSTRKPMGVEGMKTYESTTSDILVKVGTGDITNLEVDAIVNAANKDLDHIGGVARAIAEAAGPGFDKECQQALQSRDKEFKTGDVCVTGAGNMPAKKVLHAVGPAMDQFDNEEDAEHMLQKTFEETLFVAQEERCQSVAIPAISSGAFGFSMEVVAKMASEALHTFLESENTHPVRMIIFVDIRPEMIDCIQKAMRRLVKKGILKSGSAV